MLSISTQRKLASTIQAIAEAERQSEVARQILAEQPLFEPYTAYKRLDQSRAGELNYSDVIEFLNDNNVGYTRDEATYLFKKFDQDKDGRISYSDFLKTILPREDTRLRQIASLRESYYLDKNMLLPNEVEYALAKLFQQEINNYRYVKPSNQILVGSLDFDSLEAFKSLDLFNLGFITIDSLDMFMRSQGYPLGVDQLQAFFRSVDQDQDGRITYSELVEAVHLMEPLSYLPPRNAVVRQVEIERALERSRALERLYLSSYPYYFYPYYPTYYPASYYPYLSLAEIRLRESSIDRLRASRLASIQTESRIREINAEARRSLERSRSIERLQQIEIESRLRQSRLEERARQREADAIRENELRASRERLRNLESESRIRQIEAENRSLALEREIRLSSIERQNRLRALEEERRLIDSNIRLRSIERINSLERLRHAENLRRIDREYTDLVRQSQLNAPLYSSSNDYSPVKNINTSTRTTKMTESLITTSKIPYTQSQVRRTVNYY